MKTEAMLGTFRVFAPGHYVAVHTVNAKSGWSLDRAYISAPLVADYFDDHPESCGTYGDLIGYDAMAPEDVEEHFGLELSTEVLLGFYRACEAQFKGMYDESPLPDLDRIERIMAMMEKAHDALAMALTKRKMAS